jgi:plastocyanin
MAARLELPRPVRSRLAAAAALAVLVLAMAACGDDSTDVGAGSGDATTTTASDDGGGGGGDYGSGGSGGGDSADETYITAKDFSLTSLTVAPGADVKVENEGENPHTVTADDGAFDTDTIGPGSSGSFPAPMDPGDYTFHCSIHPSMTGTLTVQG